jgi:hypothetical protein
MKSFLPLVFLLLTSPLLAQLSVPKEVEPYEPIIVAASITPAPNQETQIAWRTSDKVKFETLNNGTTLHVWAPPGNHTVEATVATQTYREITVLIPDPNNPTDLTKAKTEKVKIALSFTINRYVGAFTVKGAVPVPPQPGPGPEPTPAPVPTAEMQALVAPVKAIMGRADAAKSAVWAGAWDDFHVAVKSSTNPPATLAAFKQAVQAFLNAAAAKANLAGAFPGFSAELEKAYVARFGAEDGKLDQAKGAEFIAAIAWACRR